MPAGLPRALKSNGAWSRLTVSGSPPNSPILVRLPSSLIRQPATAPEPGKTLYKNRPQAREGGRDNVSSGNILSLRAMIDRLTKADSLRGMVGNKEELRTAARSYYRYIALGTDGAGHT